MSRILLPNEWSRRLGWTLCNSPKDNHLPKLVVVSNKVALPDKSGQARAGGLEVAVKAALKQRPGVWFGWSGKVAN